MNEPEVTIQPIVPPPSPAPRKKFPRNVLFIDGILLLIILVPAVLYVKSSRESPITQLPVPTPLPAVSPTPLRVLSRVASSSAFAAYHSAVVTLSNSLNAFNLQDATLTPPILNTDLGLIP